jgi:carbon monoxide dehydrogenase subunit G
MADLTRFKSRDAVLKCAPEQFYNFITDMRNFGRIIPSENINEWNATAESCSFKVSPLGNVTLRISGKTQFSAVQFRGNALMSSDFSLYTTITENNAGRAVAGLIFEADFNPVMKMMAAAPLQQFLDTLADEMEKFSGW